MFNFSLNNTAEHDESDQDRRNKLYKEFQKMGVGNAKINFQDILHFLDNKVNIN